MTENKSVRPSSTLVPHDVQLRRVQRPDGRLQVVAEVHCERRDCTLDVAGACRACERFARIEVHEAGYCMLCRSQDETSIEDE